MKSADCLTLAVLMACGLTLAAAPAWADKKNPPPPPPPHVAPPPRAAPPPQARPQPMQQMRPAQQPQAMQRPAAAARPNQAMQQRPAANQAGQRPAANQAAQQHPAQAAREARQAQQAQKAEQAHTAAEQRRQQQAAGRPERAGKAAQAAANRPMDGARAGEQRGGMAAARSAALAAGQRPGGAAANQQHFNEHVRDPAREHVIAASHEHDFHTRDVRRFSVQERERWRGGRWHNDWHSGRFGWWFQVDDVWYAYPAPVFPYPLEVAPIVVEDAVGPIVEDQQPLAAAAVIVIAPLPPLPRAAYHCSNPEGFFPSVEECNVDWVAVGAH